MSASANSDKIPQEYVNNENPFAYIGKYSENPFLESATKSRLDALQHMQPKFIPLGIDMNTLKTEEMLKTKVAIDSRIRELLNNGMKLIENCSGMDQESSLKENIDVPGVLDILIDVNRLKLFYNQRRLREKVYHILKGSIPPNIVNAMVSASVEEDYLTDFIEYEELEKLMSVAGED